MPVWVEKDSVLIEDPALLPLVEIVASIEIPAQAFAVVRMRTIVAAVSLAYGLAEPLHG